METENVKTFAANVGKHPKTVIRRALKLGFTVGLNDDVPAAVRESMSTGSPPQPGGSLNGSPPPAKVALPTAARERPAQAERKVARVKVDYVHGVLFGNQLIIILSAVLLIAVDALSFGWIAWNVYGEFRIAAASIFALAGFAVGYSAIKNFVGYDGYNHAEWMWGFGAFQFLLHICAMEVLGEFSFFVGKIVIALGLPLATAGLAIALKKSKV